jgi:hypothetical protein
MARHPVHLLGSIPLENANEVFATIGKTFGTLAPRIPDGETDRPWMQWLDHAVKSHPSFEQVEETDPPDPDLPRFPGRKVYGLKRGIDPATLTFTLRHAEVAQRSYEVFARAQERGDVPKTAKFLFPIAAPADFVQGHILGAHQLVVEAAYERAILAEVAKMAKTIPRSGLAIQWDAPVETWTTERGTRTRYGATEAEMMTNFTERLVRLGDGVPEGVDLVYHFCYGDPFHKHIVEPKDTRVMVELANRLSSRVKRTIELFHMPVPRGRADDDYFLPLKQLRMKRGCELCLGLVHVTDGAEGTLRRMATADKFVRDYYIGTECGMGRRDKSTIAALLRVHAEVAGSVPV